MMKSSSCRTPLVLSVALRQAAVVLLGVHGLLFGPDLHAGTLTAVDDQANTLQNTAVTITVLANDTDAATNQMAILQATRPAHGSVILNSNGPPLNAELSRLFEFAGMQLSNSVVQIGDTNQYPRATQTNGLWATYPVSNHNWVCGFFPGSLWYLYEHTGDARYRAWAEGWTAGIASQQYVTGIPDLGFMFNNSFGAGYRLTGNAAYGPVVIQAARSVIAGGGYNTAVGCIGQIWSLNTLAVAIDWLMNLELLFRASALSGDGSLYTAAFRSAETMMANHIRPDGSTFQMVYYNAKTGAIIEKGTFTGASDLSTWARGQAWATYGLTMVYRETGDPRFLDSAQRLADYYLANVAADQVPYWDYQATNIPYAPKDSSAAAITLSALVELSELATNLQDSARYWQGARGILDSLSSTNYLAQGSPSSGILLHGTGEPPHFPHPEVDVSLVYGDYYFIEALRRYVELYRHTTLTYVPDPGFQGTDTFTYQVCSSGGNCATAVVTVVVEPITPNPFAASIALAPVTLFPEISFPTTAGRRYEVQCRDSLLASDPWSALATNLPGSGSVMSVSDTNPPSHRFYRVGVDTPPLPPPEIALEAPLGALASPFISTGSYIYQPTQTLVVADGGRAVYDFTVPDTGAYVITATVNAPNDGANSFFLNIDSEPQDPYMIWDIPVTAGFEQRVVSWRGNGTFDNNEFVPNVFSLTPGTHQLVIRGREAYTLLQSMIIVQYP